MAKIAAVKKVKTEKSLIVDAKAFKAAMEMGIVEKKTTIPILVNVLFEPQGKTLRLVTTDLEEFVITEIDAKSTLKDSFTLPWRKVIDLLKGEDGPITFTPLDNNFVKMSTGGVDYKLVGMAPTNYPARPEIPAATFQLPGKMLKEMLAHTAFCISQEESRYTLNGALFRFMTDEFVICATDGHRLAIEKRALDLSVGGKTTDTIVRTVALQWLQKRLSDSNVGITLAATDANHPMNVFHLPHLRTTLFTRKLTGQFPNYEAIMPQKKSIKSVAEFASAAVVHNLLTKVAKCADERSGAVRLHLNGNATLSAQSTESGEAKAVIPGVVTGNEIQIGLSSEYLGDVLKIAGKNSIVLSLSNNQSAVAV